MRPRRNILLWSERVGQAGELAFMLNTRAHVIAYAAASVNGFMWALMAKPQHYDGIVLLGADHAVIERLSIFAHNRSNPCPLLPLSPDVSAAELLERVHVLTARRRGPKPAQRPAQRPESLAEVA